MRGVGGGAVSGRSAGIGAHPPRASWRCHIDDARWPELYESVSSTIDKTLFVQSGVLLLLVAGNDLRYGIHDASVPTYVRTMTISFRSLYLSCRHLQHTNNELKLSRTVRTSPSSPSGHTRTHRYRPARHSPHHSERDAAPSFGVSRRLHLRRLQAWSFMGTQSACTIPCAAACRAVHGYQDFLRDAK